MKLFWASKYSIVDGNAYGYHMHNTWLREYVEKLVEVTDDINEADAAITITSPEFFVEPVPGMPNFLFTMFEGTELPQRFVDGLAKADYLFTPSTWVKNLFDKHFDPNKVFVCNHGVKPEFTYKKRKLPTNKPFRYLWVGAPNPRKGYEEVTVVWQHADFAKQSGVELYIKTTKVKGVERRGNVILDGRNLDFNSLLDLYHSAHCFILPTRGEGFGLTLAEAMATGLPCIATNYSGVTDFFNASVGFPIGYKMGKGVYLRRDSKEKDETVIAFPDVKQLAKNMFWVYSHYKKALLRGDKASRWIKKNFTWEASAKTLVDIIQREVANEKEDDGRKLTGNWDNPYGTSNGVRSRVAHC